MVILSQSRSDNSFFIGMSLEEYFEQIKPLKKNLSEDMMPEEHLLTCPLKEDIQGDFKQMLIDVYGYSEIFEVYVSVKRDLSSAFIAVPNFPFNSQWYQSPWEKFPPTKISNVTEIKNINFIDYSKKDSVKTHTKVGLYGLEIFQLSLPNKTIFLQVCDILNRDKKYVRVRELESYEKIIDGEVFDKITLNEKRTGFQKLENPIMDNHEFYYIKDGENFYIPIEIKFEDKLYKAIQKYSDETLVPGIYYAEMVGDGTNDNFHKLVHTAFKRRNGKKSEERHNDA